MNITGAHDLSSDNVLVRLREGRCLVSTVGRPFRTAYWQDADRAIADLGLAAVTPEARAQPETHHRFLATLARSMEGGARFQPGTIGFPSTPQAITARERFRAENMSLVLLGRCSREVTVGAWEAATHRLSRAWRLDVQIREWDGQVDFPPGRERSQDILRCQTRSGQGRTRLTLFSNLEQAEGGWWQFLYDWPSVRIGWVAADLVGCGDKDHFARYRKRSISWKNLEMLSTAGAWPHVVLPVSAANAAILPDLVVALVAATRGGTVELVPAPLHASEPEAASPRLDDYVSAVLAIYRNTHVPLRLVTPLSWVAARVDSRVPEPSSPMDAGAELAVLPNGDLYAGQAAVGLEEWRLGNVLHDPATLRWERLDAMPEVLSKHAKPAACQGCDWRYRCGGVDCAVALFEERKQAGGTELGVEVSGRRMAGPAPGAARHRAASCDEESGGWVPRHGSPAAAQEATPTTRTPSLFDLYCAPRKALFEEMIWECIDAACEASVARGRELVELQDMGMDFRPAAAMPQEGCR